MSSAAGGFEEVDLRQQLQQAIVDQNAALASVEELLDLDHNEELLQVGRWLWPIACF